MINNFISDTDNKFINMPLCSFLTVGRRKTQYVDREVISDRINTINNYNRANKHFTKIIGRY